MQAIWQAQILAESDDTVVVDGNHYFPLDSLQMKYFKTSDSTSFCGWKGTANYYTVIVNGQENVDAAWYYAEPKDAAKQVAARVAFWKGVEVR